MEIQSKEVLQRVQFVFVAFLAFLFAHAMSDRCRKAIVVLFVGQSQAVCNEKSDAVDALSRSLTWLHVEVANRGYGAFKQGPLLLLFL